MKTNKEPINQSRKISLNYLARVEGEGSLSLTIDDGKISEAAFKIFEPPRFFEGFLRDRSYLEAPDITARICGICPIAYQMSSVHAMEQICNIKIDKNIRELRRLLYCGEWIESHALHIFMLHAPDFLGYPDAIAMAKDHRQVVENGLKLKKIGNEIVQVLGGREIHPVNVRVGGFYRVPDKNELNVLLDKLKEASDLAYQTVLWTSKLDFPDFEYDYEFVSLVHPLEYPMNEGRVGSNKGLDIGISEYENYFSEIHVERSNALHSVLEKERPYLTGPLARYSLNFDKLTKNAQEVAREAGLDTTCYNPFKSIIVRAVEVLYACEEAIRVINEYKKPPRNYTSGNVEGGIGYGITEAPRGLLYHKYQIDDEGKILDAKIVPPTSQNQKMIEEDLKRLAQQFLDLNDEELTWKCEQSIRNYDPCISCATHFLKLDIKRT